MKPEEQRIAIAEACGWRSVYREGTVDFGMCGPDEFWDKYPGWISGKPSDDAQLAPSFAPPDYLNDLNACHAAERSTVFKDVKLYLRFATELESVVGGNIDALFATAPQRCEALLRTLNIWVEDREAPSVQARPEKCINASR